MKLTYEKFYMKNGLFILLSILVVQQTAKRVTNVLCVPIALTLF